ncbi:helix-turn-helix domain-containing protein [Halorussus salinus]|uniref:hypothetical protein n=1 Tax=Halorussus salinus TaxID=1364935 RepID=UPI0010920B0C|nr:hypothetical protein [Halorussus salinus]
MSRDGRPQKLNDDELLAVAREAVADGETDLLEGGVPADVIADRVPLSPSTVETHLRRLVEEDRLVRVQGADPVSYRPRESYLPTEEGTSTVDS